jgi:sec-independent protein translocase protein TatB
MFGIGFTELMLIGVVALVVIGPERLPKVARTAGAWLGRLNRYASQVKADIDREMRLDELREVQKSMKDSVQKYEIMADDAVQQVKQEAGEAQKVVREVADEIAADPNAKAADAVTEPVVTIEHKSS